MLRIEPLFGVSTKGFNRGRKEEVVDGIAMEIALVSIDQINYLRKRIKDALTMRSLEEARDILEAALAETDVGKMKVWQPDEEPF